MRFARSLFNLTLVALGGILGNLLAAWIQQEAWGDAFTPLRLALTLGGGVLVLLLLAWLDTRGSGGAGGGPGDQPPPGANRNRQIGKDQFIRVLRGANAYGNWQIGVNQHIEVIDASLPDRDRISASDPGSRRSSLQRQLADKKQLLNLLEEQLAGFPPGSEPAEKLLQARKLRDDIRKIENDLDNP